jgi:hypothetical protein
MPYVKKINKMKVYRKKTSFKKKATVKTFKRRVAINKPMVNMGLGFPKKLLVTHKYNDLTTGTTNTGVPQKVLWSCNGMFDPYFTGGGHQPYYFDQYSALYDHYCVIASKATIILTPTGTGVVACCAGVFINDDTTTVPTDINTLGELSQGRFRNFNNQSTPIKFTLKWSAKKTFGGNVLSNTELQGTIAANPTEQSFYTFWIGAMDQASSQTYVVQVFIEYIAIWKELKEVAQS